MRKPQRTPATYSSALDTPEGIRVYGPLIRHLGPILDTLVSRKPGGFATLVALTSGANAADVNDFFSRLARVHPSVGKVPLDLVRSLTLPGDGDETVQTELVEFAALSAAHRLAVTGIAWNLGACNAVLDLAQALFSCGSEPPVPLAADAFGIEQLAHSQRSAEWLAAYEGRTTLRDLADHYSAGVGLGDLDPEDLLVVAYSAIAGALSADVVVGTAAAVSLCWSRSSPDVGAETLFAAERACAESPTGPFSKWVTNAYRIYSSAGAESSSIDT